MSTLTLNGISKVYDSKVKAVSDFTLEIDDQEFIVFVGPSGCGKSTTLRMIAGLEDISAGELFIDGKRMNDVQPKDRNIAMVFQNYALYPHLSVFDNMSFGLKMRKVPKLEIRERVEKAAEILDLVPYLKRKPKALSGGQRQRVALGRAIVRDANIFLMDEPLSNLDSKLRVQMRTEIMKLHNDLKTTTIYVTHDQTEAMTMASRIVIMRDGVIQQIGTPREVYNQPSNMFVAGFIGSPSMNFFKGLYKSGILQIGTIKIPLLKEQHILLAGYEGKEIVMGIRAEFIGKATPSIDSHQFFTFTSKVVLTELTGSEQMVFSSIADQTFVGKMDSKEWIRPNEQIHFAIQLEFAHFFDKDSELRISE